jgi:hypothetical protein
LLKLPVIAAAKNLRKEVTCHEYLSQLTRLSRASQSRWLMLLINMGSNKLISTFICEGHSA